MSDPSITYRDATYSAATQEKLRSLYNELLSVYGPGAGVEDDISALQDVIARWDANDATETTFE